MKRALLFFAVIFAALAGLSSCGVGSYSVSSGKEDTAGLCFTDSGKYSIVVTVDGQDYRMQTVKAKAYKPGMKIKKTALNTVKIAPGQHDVTVRKGNHELFSKRLFLSTGEDKIINL